MSHKLRHHDELMIKKGKKNEPVGDGLFACKLQYWLMSVTLHVSPIFAPSLCIHA